jgi:hypothetical protein
MAFSKGQSGNPAGRPKGAPNRTTAMIRSACPDVLRTVIDAAKGGDMAAASLILSRGVPTLKASHEPVQILTAGQLEAMSPAQRAEAINAAALSGRVPADVASALLEGIAKGCTILESTELAERVAELEQRAEQQRAHR